MTHSTRTHPYSSEQSHVFQEAPFPPELLFRQNVFAQPYVQMQYLFQGSYLESDFDDVQWADESACHHASRGPSQSGLLMTEHGFAGPRVIAHHPSTDSKDSLVLKDVF